MTPLIQARNLRHRYEDGTIALDGVDFDLVPGETVALLGRNGSGKTTFVLQLTGLLHGDGEILICGERVTKESLGKIRSRVGMVFQDSDEQLFMPTVLEDVCFGPRNLGIEPGAATERAHRYLSEVGMLGAIHRAPYHLSAGEKRRVALAGVLAMEPEILILDEPTTFLDPPAQRDLVKTLRSLPQAKVLVTHDIPFARALATRAVFFEQGKIAAQGSLEEIVRRYVWEL